MHSLRPVVGFVALLAVTALMGCGRSAAGGPAWPAPSQTADDGGESLEPRPGATYASASERAADAEPAEVKATEAAATTPAENGDDATPEVTPSAGAGSSDDVLMTEEIIIEIEE